MSKRAALYLRVSTDKQTVENQRAALIAIAERRGWEIVTTYSDAGISGAKGRKDRPGLDQMLKDAQRRAFYVVIAWAIDRLGRSLIDLLGTIQELEACGVDLFPRTAVNRYHHAKRQADVSDCRGICRI